MSWIISTIARSYRGCIRRFSFIIRSWCKGKDSCSFSDINFWTRDRECDVIIVSIGSCYSSNCSLIFIGTKRFWWGDNRVIVIQIININSYILTRWKWSIINSYWSCIRRLSFIVWSWCKGKDSRSFSDIDFWTGNRECKTVTILVTSSYGTNCSLILIYSKRAIWGNLRSLINIYHRNIYSLLSCIQTIACSNCCRISWLAFEIWSRIKC